jgi:hypothetical protein
MNGALLCFSLLTGALARGAFYGADHKARPENRQEKDPGTVHKWERAGAALAGAATFGGLLALPNLLGQVFADAGKGLGLFILVIVTAVAAAFGFYAIARGQQHHRHSTLALGIVLGGAAALDYGDWQVIRANTGKYLASAGHGITGAGAGKAGTAAAHGHAAGGGTLGVILILAAAAVLILIVVGKHRGGEVVNVATAKRPRALPAAGSKSAGARPPAAARPGRGPFADPVFTGGDGH